ncbi:MAG: hypothetical protein EHM12_12830, partial [Dehalococcoidia bacterium]
MPTIFTESHKSWLEKAALAGAFDQPRLNALVGSQDGRAAFKWLVGQQTLVRAVGASGRFVLDRTLADALLQTSAPDLSSSRRSLLDYLDREIAARRAEWQKSPTPKSRADYESLLLERLTHTLALDDKAEIAQFFQAGFIEALNEHPPFMFDLLAQGREGSEQRREESEQRRGESEQKESEEGNREGESTSF